MKASLGILLLFSALFAGSAVRAEPPVDRDQMEQVEDLSESLANDLLALSVDARNRDMPQVARYFPASLNATAFPVAPGETNTEVKWIQSHSWNFSTQATKMSHADFLKAWEGFYSHFSEVEDVRFKVKEANFADDSHGAARVFMFVVGRDGNGHREWVQSWMSARFALAPPDANGNRNWQFTDLSLESFESIVATADLFSEVSVPAGVALTIPRYGEPSNQSFAWNGAAAADVDGDGDIDVFAAGLDRHHLYLNDGKGKFVKAGDEVGVSILPGEVTGPLFVDYDNDGDSDLFLAAVGNQLLLENRLVPDGKLTFVDVSIEAGVNVSAIGFSAVAGDINSDGLPDIYVASYNRYGTVMPNSWGAATNGTPNRLFVNQGNGKFAEKAAEFGLDDSRWSYAAEFADFDGDGDQDLYVANDYGLNALYVNDGGRFTDQANLAGVTDPGNGMGVSFGDYDNDGDLDLHVTNMSSTAGNRILKRIFPQQAQDPDGALLRKLAAGNSLFENQGDGTFRDVTKDVGGLSGGWAWGGGFMDFDNDGWEDLYNPNGFVSGKFMKDT